MSFAMFSLILILFIFKCVESQDKPTKESVCADPKFDASLAITNTGADGSPVYKRYLFKGNFVLPYIRNETIETIDWQNIQLITDVFKGLEGYVGEGVWIRRAKELDGKVFIQTSNGTKIYELNKEDDYKMVGDVGRSWRLDYEFIQWNLNVVIGNRKGRGGNFFFDVNTKLMGKKERNRPYEHKYPGGNFTVWMVNNEDNIQTLKNSENLIPIIFLYKQNRIPVDYKHCYQTKTKETIYFRDYYACVSQLWSADRWDDSEYCRSFVSTRSIIGCDEKSTKPEKPVNSVPESDPNEPEEDIAPDV